MRGERRKPKKSKIEERAIKLADLTEKEWFKPTPKHRLKGGLRNPAARKSGDDRDPESTTATLTLLDLVAVAAPVIEEFAETKITRPSDCFDALYKVAVAYSDEVARNLPHRNIGVAETSVQRALYRSRAREKNQISKAQSPRSNNLLVLLIF